MRSEQSVRSPWHQKPEHPALEIARWLIVAVILSWGLVLLGAAVFPQICPLDRPADTVYVRVPPDSLVCEQWRWINGKN